MGVIIKIKIKNQISQIFNKYFKYFTNLNGNNKSHRLMISFHEYDHLKESINKHYIS
jgi:hypothetical protein